MVSLREATYYDIEVVLKLRISMLTENIDKKKCDIDLIEEENRKYLIKNLSEKIIVWLAEYEGVAVSVCAVLPFERPPIFNNITGLEGNVINMYTTPAWRNQGIASLLLSKIIAYMKEKNTARLWLRSTTAGLSIYKKAGFQLYGIDILSQTFYMEINL